MKEPCRQSFEELPLPVKFKLINDCFTARLNEDLKEDDLTFQQSAVLHYLRIHAERSVTQKEICEHLRVTHPTLVGILTRMEEKRLIERAVDEENRRNRIVTLTDKAWAILERGHQKRLRRAASLVKGIDEEELEVLNRTLEKMYRNLRPEQPVKEQGDSDGGKK